MRLPCRKVREKLHELLARHFPPEHFPAFPVLTVQVKGVLAKIDSYERHILHDGSPW
jgi:hypothetical protein